MTEVLNATPAEQGELPTYPMARAAGCPFDPPPRLLELNADKPLHRVRIWNGTTPWLITGYDEVRALYADPRVSVLFESVLFEIEQFHAGQGLQDRRALRVSGPACVRTDREALRLYNPRAARKYFFNPGGMRNALAHPRQLWLRRYYVAQSARKGQACVIEVTPERVELLWQICQVPDYRQLQLDALLRPLDRDQDRRQRLHSLADTLAG